jgi:hypothetical protein
MSKIENPKKLSQQKNQHLSTQCSETFYRVFSEKYVFQLQNVVQRL